MCEHVLSLIMLCSIRMNVCVCVHMLGSIRAASVTFMSVLIEINNSDKVAEWPGHGRPLKLPSFLRQHRHVQAPVQYTYAGGSGFANHGAKL